MNRCDLCGTENEDGQTRCGVCQHELSPEPPSVDIETIDESRTQLSPRRLTATLALLLATIIPWWWMSDLLSLPKDVELQRMNHKLLKISYENQTDHWHQQKEQLLRLSRSNRNGSPGFTEVPLELVMAYFSEDLELGSSSFPNLAWFPCGSQDKPRLLLTREERKVGPWPIFLALELEFTPAERGYHLTCKRLRRGRREVSPDLAWQYFSQEMAHLKSLEPFLAQIEDLHFFQHVPDEARAEAGGYVSWIPLKAPSGSQAGTL